jgi:hypothetical protein
MSIQSGRSGGVGTGRTSLNPPNCKKVTRQMVMNAANKINVEVRREGKGMWWFKRKSEWMTLGQTNFLAWYTITEILTPNHIAKALEIIKEETENADVRKYTCINGVGYSQVERNIAERIVKLFANK